MPVVLLALAGPDHRIVAANAAYRAFTGRSDAIGLPYREAFPGIEGQPLHELLDRVYATGEPETGKAWRAQIDRDPGGLQEVYGDFTVAPRRATDGTVDGLLVIVSDVTDQVAERRAARQRARDAENGYEVVAELQRALLPTALPVLPQVRIAARYLVAGDDQAAGGDWFDAIPLGGGSVALVVGDVVGHGLAASAAMGQIRAVLAELLAAEPDLARVLERADAYAARTPALRATTLTLAVFDPADGTLRYTTCGHPPPLMVGADGMVRFLAGTGTGPLGTGSAPRLAVGAFAPGELMLLYSDGLIERPHRTIEAGMAELAKVAADAAANRTLSAGAAPTAAERVCQLTVELLTRTGYADDVTALAVERLADLVPALHLELPSERASLTVAREAFTSWLNSLGATAEDTEALHLAMVEVVTNAIEHAYPPGTPGIVALDATLADDGNVECRVTDHGHWRRPDTSDADRGHGLMVAGHVVDTLLVSHPAGPPGSPGTGGTVVSLRLRLRRPAFLAWHHESARAAAYSPGPAFTVDTSIEESGVARARVTGAVDIVTAGQLARRLLSASRGGTVPLVADLTGVTQLASAGVRALYQVRDRLTVHQQDLTLVAAPGSSAQVVLDLVQLAHVAADDPGRPLGAGERQPERADDVRVGGHRTVGAPVLDAALKLRERGGAGQRIAGAFDQGDVDETDLVLEPERGVAQSVRILLRQLGEHGPDKALVLVRALRLGRVADDLTDSHNVISWSGLA
jgi:serine phosphatase RsbU (regulator of sigma subunit)/anti-sigma regulatory factor (Ser/Thr protein kinase)/anti-anti-sigma regulatory factor